MPKILENEALALVENIDSLAPEQQAQAADILRRYREQQHDLGEPEWPSYEQAEQESESRFRSLFDDLNNVDKQSPSFVQSLKFRTDPDAGRARVAGTAFLSRVYQKQPEEVSRMFPLLRDDYLNKRGQKTGLDDRAFYSFAQGEVKRMTAREKAALEGAKAALRGEDSGKALAAWQAANPDFSKEDSGFFSSGFNKAMEEDGDSLPVAANLLSLLESGSFKSKDGKAVSTPFTDEQAAQLGGMVEQLAGMKPRQRKSIYRAMNARIEAAGYDSKGFWAQMLSELDRGLYRASTTLGTQAGVLSDVMEAQANASQRSVDFSLDGGGGFSTPVLSVEEQQQLQRQRDFREQVGNVQAELQDIVAGRLDPVKPTVSWLNDTLETGMIKGPGAVAPFMAASAALGPWGAGILFTADFAEQNRRDLVGMGMDADQARQIGAVAAPAQAAVESLSNLFQLGRFPAVSAALARFTKPVGGASLVGRYVQNSLLAGITEFTEEQIQDNLIVPASQKLLAALNSDMPDVDWSFYKERAIQATPELAATLLPMALVFGGVMTAADAKLSAQMTGNIDALTALNFSQAQATEIVSQKTTEERIAKAASLWRSRAGNKASLEEGAKNLSAKLRELSSDTLKHQQELERRGILPRMLHAQDDSWLLTYNDGSTASFATHGEASKARWNWAEDQLGRMHALTREALTSMERNMSAGRELAVEFKPDARTAQDVVNEGAGMDQVLRRVEQGKALGDVPVEESFDNASAFDQATQDAEGFLSSLQILGSSRNEFKDGILRTTIKLWEGSNVLTLVEEKLEGDAKAILQSSTGRAWMLGVLRNYEQESGDKLFRDVADTGITNDDLAEAWSHLGQSYLVGRSSFGEPLQQNNMRRFSKLLMRAGLAGAINAESTFWQAVVNRAQKLGELKKAGKLGDHLAAELERQLGIDSQVVHEQGAMQEAQQVAQDVAQQVDTSGYSEANPGPNGETFSASRAIPADASKVVQMPDGARLVGPTTFSIRAFHGTPHKVDKFSLSKIGTGEGAQAYGWGLYFAENQDVARVYSHQLAGTDIVTKEGKVLSSEDYPPSGMFSPETVKSMVDNAVGNAQGNPKQAVAQLKEDGTYISKLLSEFLQDQINKGSVFKARGNLYTVELLPDESEFLDWDKPLSEQKNPKLDALKKQHRAFLQDPAQRISDKGKNGDSLYHMVTRQKGSEKAASEYLASLGIPGIRYLDGGSRGAGDGTRNYVIFDENLVRILEENGKPVENGQTFSIAPSALSVKPPKGVIANKTDALPSWTLPKSEGSVSKVLNSPKVRAEFYAKLDKAIEWLRADPAQITTAKGWVTFMRKAGVWGEIPMPPSGLADIIADPAAYVAKLNGGYHGEASLSDTQTSAKQGMDGTVEMRKLIGEGKAPAPFVVALHNMWGILSRMLSPIDQEGMWLRLIAHRPVLDAIQASIDGKFSMTVAQWKQVVQDARASSAVESGPIGNAATSNANDFYLMLSRLNGRWNDMADVYAAPNSREMGRRFWNIGAGKLGIKNKVQRFIGLTFGTPGVIMDRWKFVEFWLPTAMEGMQADQPSTYFDYSANTPSDPVGVYGVYGGIDSENEALSLAMYEAFEVVLEESIAKSQELQDHLGEHANAGGMHWFGWNAIKNEAVGHSSLDLTKELIATFGLDIDAEKVHNTVRNGIYYTEGSPSAGNTVKFVLERGKVRVERTTMAGGLQPGRAGRNTRGAGSRVAEGRTGTIEAIGETFSLRKPTKKQLEKILPGAKYIAPDELMDADIRGPVVIGAYHGTTHTIEQFTDERANLENDMGAGVYASTSIEDVNANYAGEGPDLTQRIELTKEQLVNDGMDEDEAEREARNMLKGHGGAVIPLLLPMRNPVVLWKGRVGNATNKGTFIEFRGDVEQYRDEAEELVMDREGITRDELPDYQDQVQDAMYEIEAEKDFDGVLAKIARVVDSFDDTDSGALVSSLDPDGMYAADLEQELRKNEGTVYATSGDNGQLAVGELVRRVFMDALGFDGIIDKNVNNKFGSRGRGKAMAGMDDNTAHIIVATDTELRPRSAFNTDTTFSLRPGDFASRVEAMFSPFQRSPEARLVMARVAKDRALRLGNELIDKANGIRRIADLEREAKTREAFKADELINQGVQEQEARRVAKQQAQDWLATARKEAGSPKSQRERIKAWLRVLDGILAAVPAEVRARVGGYTKMAGIATDEAALRYLENRVEKLNAELEKFLIKDARQQLERIFDKSRPKTEAGEKAKGKLTPEAHAWFNLAEQAAKLSPAVADERIEGIEKSLSEEMSEAVKQELSDWLGRPVTDDAEAQEWQEQRLTIFQTFGSVLYGTDSKAARNAAETTAAFELARKVYQDGRLANLEETAKRREKRAADRADGISRVGSPYDPNKANARKKALNKASGLKGRILDYLDTGLDASGFFLDLLGHGDLYETTRRNILEAEMSKDDAMRKRKADFAAMLQKVFPGKSLVARLRGLWELQNIQEGTPVGSMSQLQAVQLTLWWMDLDSREWLESNGYGQAWQAQAESWLTSEARAVRSWLLKQYEDQYNYINPVFRRLRGVNLPRVDVYGGKRQVEHSKSDSSVSLEMDQMRGGMEAGFTKTRVARPSGPPKMTDALQNYWQNAFQVEHYVAFAETITELKAVFGHRDFRLAVETNRGQDKASQVSDIIKNLEQAGTRDAFAHTAQGKLFGRYGKAVSATALLFKLSVIAKQAAAMIQSMFKVGFKEYMTSLGRILSGKGAIALGDMYRSDTVQRRLSEYDGEMAQAAKGWNQRHFENEIIDKAAIAPDLVMNAGWYAIGWTDARFTTVSAAVAYDVAFRNAKSLGMPDDEAKAYAKDEADLIVMETAQPQGVATKSLFENQAPSSLLRLLFAFQSANRQAFGLAWLAAKTSKKDTANALFTAALISAIAQTAGGLMRMLTTDDEPEDIFTPEAYLLGMSTATMTGIPLMGPVVEFAAALFGAEPRTAVNPAAATLKSLSDLFDGKADSKDISTIMNTVGLALGGRGASIGVGWNVLNQLMGLYESATDQ